MVNGFLMMVRDYEEGGIYVEAVEDWEEYEGWRMIYCQAVSDVGVVREKIDRWREENSGGHQEKGDMNEVVADMVSSLQWIANEHPLRCFRHPSN